MNALLEKNKVYTELVRNIGATGNWDSKDWFESGWSAGLAFNKECDKSLAEHVASYLREGSAVHRAAKLVEIETMIRKLGVRL